MRKTRRRLPKGYDGTKFTTRKITEILPAVLARIHHRHEERHDLVLGAWQQVIGPQMAPFAQAVSFADGILHVVVKNSTLYSLLCRKEKSKILSSLQSKFPKVEIRDIYFRMG